MLMNTNKILRVIIVDDYQIFRKGLVMLFEEISFAEIVGQASNGQEFLQILRKTDADIVLMNVKMPIIDSIEATKKALQRKPGLKIIALSMFEDEEYIKSMLNAGVKGYLLKSIEKEELEHALKIVAAGKNYYSQELSSIIINKLWYDNSKKNQSDISEKLTKREVEILKLICEGYTNQQIGENLFISQRTVEGHRANMLSKTGVNNTAQLIAFAIKNELVEF